MTDLDWEYYQNKDFMTRLGHTVTPDAVKAKIMMSFISVVMVQFGTSKIMKIYKKLTQEIYENNDVASVCHGAIGLLNVKDAEGNYIIDGKTVTGFSNSEEQAVGLADVVPYLTEDELKNRGANYEQGDNWTEFVADGRIITGQKSTIW